MILQSCSRTTKQYTEFLHLKDKIKKKIFFYFSVKPEVHPVPDNGVIVTTVGDSVTLECEVTRGFPTPVMQWTRKERKMPTGEDSIEGLSLTYTAVTRHHSGIYICSADNGFGQASVANLKLDVQRKCL